MAQRFIELTEEELTGMESGAAQAPSTGKYIEMTDEELNAPFEPGMIQQAVAIMGGARGDEVPRASGFLAQARDLPIQAFKGAGTGVRMLTDIFGANNPVSKAIAGYEDTMDAILSAESRQDSKEMSRILDEAKDKGTYDQVIAGLQAISKAPLETAFNVAGIAVPTLAAGAAGRALQLGKVGITAIGAGIGASQGAGNIKGQIYQGVVDELRNSGETDEEKIHNVASEAQAYNGKNLDQILIGAGLGAVAASTGAEKVLNRVIGGVGLKPSANIFANILKGGITEAVPEGFQGGQEQLAQNLALQRMGRDVPTMRGVVSQATMEAAAGAPLGGFGGAVEYYTAPKPPPIPKPPEVQEQEDIERQANIEASRLMTPTGDRNSEAVLNRIQQNEQAVENLRGSLSTLEPTSLGAASLRMEINARQDELATLRDLQIRLGREIAQATGVSAPIMEAPIAPTEPETPVTQPTPTEVPAEPIIGEIPQTSPMIGEQPAEPIISEIPETSELVGAEPIAVVEQEQVATAEAPAITPTPVAETPAVAPAPEVAPTSWVAPEQKLTPQENRALQVASLKGTEKRTGNITFVPEKLMTPQRLQSLRTEKESSGPLKDFPRGGKFIEIKMMADVTGDPNAKGWAIIDRRIDLNRREWIAQIPNRDERILAGSIANKESEKIVSAIKDGSITQERSNQLVDEAVNNQIISSDFANNLRTAISNSTPAVSETITPEKILSERAIRTRIEDNDPVPANAIEAYGITLPEGYTKQGDLYVYQPAPPIAEAPAITPTPVAEAPAASVPKVAPAITEQEVDSEIAKTNREIASLESQRKAEALKDTPRKQVIYGFDDRIKESKEKLKSLNKQKDAFYYGKIQEQEVGLEDALQVEADKITPRDATGPLSQAETITLNGLRIDEEMSGKLSRISQIAKDRLEARATAPTPTAEAPATKVVPTLPKAIIQQLLKSGVEIIPSGNQYSGFRQLVMEKLGKPSPKSKSGTNAVKKELIQYLGVDTNDTIAGIDNSIRNKLKQMLVNETITPAPEVAPALAVTERPRIEAESPATTELRNKIKQTKGQDRRSVIQLAINDRSFFPAAIDAAETGKPLPSIEKAFVPDDVELPDRIDTTRIRLPEIKVKSPEEAASPMISYDDNRWVLGGVYFDSTNNMVVATDGRALVAIPKKITKDKIIAARNIKETTYQEAIKKGQQIDGNYPNWKAVVPTYGKDIPKVDIDIDDALKASTILDSINNTFNNKVGSSLIVFNGAKLDPKYVLSSITALVESGAKSITAQTLSEADPVLLTGDNGAIAVIMPKRGNERISHPLKSKVEIKPEIKKYNTEALLNAAKPFSEYGSNYNRNIAASYERLKNAIDNGFSESTTASIAEELEIRLKRFQPEALDKAIQQVTPSGISVGSRVKGKGPQTYIVEEVLTPSQKEAELGEQYYRIRNERTGEVGTFESKDIKPVNAKGIRKVAKDESLIVPEKDRYTFEEVQAEANKLFGGIPEGFVIVSDTTNPDYEFKAGYDIDNGNIIVNLAYIKKGESVRNLIAHELGHYAAGDPAIRAQLQAFLDGLPAEQRAKLESFVDRVYNKDTGEVRLEEKAVRAFVVMLKKGDNRNVFQKLLDTIKRWLNEKLGTKFQMTDMDAAAVLSGAVDRFRSGERIARQEEGVRRAAVDRYEERSQVGGIPGVGAIKSTPVGIKAKTRDIVRTMFNSDTISQANTNRAWNLINRFAERNPESRANLSSLNQMVRESMADEASEEILQSIGGPTLQNELFSYAIKLAGQGDKKMLDHLLENPIVVSQGGTASTIGRDLGALGSFSSWLVNASQAERSATIEVLASRLFNTKSPTPEQIAAINTVLNAVKDTKINLGYAIEEEVKEVSEIIGTDIGEKIQSEIVESNPKLDPFAQAMLSLIQLQEAGEDIDFTVMVPARKEPKLSIKMEKMVRDALAKYQSKMGAKGATGLEATFWKTLSSQEEAVGPLADLDMASNRNLAKIVKEVLKKYGLVGTPPKRGEVGSEKLSDIQLVASILTNTPLSKEKVMRADAEITAEIERRYNKEKQAVAGDQTLLDAVEIKYNTLRQAWGEAMGNQLDIPVSEASMRRLLASEMKEKKIKLRDISDKPTLAGENQAKRDVVASVIKKMVELDPQADPNRFAEFEEKLNDIMDNMVATSKAKTRADTARQTVKDTANQPDRQADSAVRSLARMQGDVPDFGKAQPNEVRKIVSNDLRNAPDMGRKQAWKSMFTASLQQAGVSETIAMTLSDLVWRQHEINNLNKQIKQQEDAVTKGPISTIVEAILNTPLGEQQDPKWRENVILQYLVDAGIPSQRASNIAKLFDAAIAKRFAEAQTRAAQKAIAGLKTLDPESKRGFDKLFIAIRAQALNPASNPVREFAKQMGFKDFSGPQLQRLSDLDTIINKDESTDAERARAVSEVQKIINEVALPPRVRDVLSSFYVGQALMRVTTALIQVVDPAFYSATNAAISSFRNVTSPTQLGQIWGDYTTSLFRAFREFAFSFQNDINRSGKMVDFLETQDAALIRMNRQAQRDLESGNYAGFVKNTLFGTFPRFTFRTLKALDDAAFSILRDQSLNQYMVAAMNAAKIPKDKQIGVVRIALQAREIDKQNLLNQGMTKTEATVFSGERMKVYVQQALSGVEIPDVVGVVESAINDALSRIGKPRYATDPKTEKEQEIKDLGTLSYPLLKLYELTSQSANQMKGLEGEVYRIFVRTFLGFPVIASRVFNVAAGYTPLTLYRHLIKGRYPLTYGTALQRKQRLIEQFSLTLAVLPLLAMYRGSDDDDKDGTYINFTGVGPSKLNKEFYAQWHKRNEPYSMQLVVDGKSRFTLDAKNSGPFSVMIYTLGAYDDWSMNRRLKDEKTTKDDFRKAEEKMTWANDMFGLLGTFILTSSRRGPTSSVMQGLVDWRRFPDNPLGALASEASFSLLPLVPIVGTGLAKNLSDLLSEPIDTTTLEGAIANNIPFVPQMLDKPALNGYGQKLGELQFAEKLKKSSGIPFTFVQFDNENDRKLTDITMKFGVGPSEVSRNDVEVSLQRSLTDEEWRGFVKSYGEANAKMVLENYDQLFNMSREAFVYSLREAIAPSAKFKAYADLEKQMEKK